MSIKDALETWIVDALRDAGGKANVASICQYIWENHEHSLSVSHWELLP